MKKIVFTSILVAVIILTVVISGILVVNYLLNRVYDVEFLSVDKEASVILKGASYEEEKNHFEFFYDDRLDFYPTVKDAAYETYFKDNTDYLYTVEADYADKEQNEKMYILMNNDHYFYIAYSEAGVTIYDGMRPCWAEHCLFSAHIPSTESFSGKKENFVPWEKTIGLSSYEDLLLYYSRLPDTVYELDEENKTVCLDVYNEYLGWMDSGIKMEVSDEGFTVTLMPEFYNMEVDRDLLWD